MYCKKMERVLDFVKKESRAYVLRYVGISLERRRNAALPDRADYVSFARQERRARRSAKTAKPRRLEESR